MGLVYNPETGELDEVADDEIDVSNYDYGTTPNLTDAEVEAELDRFREEYKDEIPNMEGFEKEVGAANVKTVTDFLSKYGKKALDLFKDDKGNLDWTKLLSMAGGAYAASRPSGSTPTGYQGKIPKLTATSNMLTAPPVGRRPGSGGINYGGGVTYRDETGKIVSSNELTLEQLREAAQGNPYSRPGTYETPVYNRPPTGGLPDIAPISPAPVNDPTTSAIQNWFRANDGKGDQAALDKWLATSGYTPEQINKALPQWGVADLRKAQRNAKIKDWYSTNEGKGDQAALDKWLATSGYTPEEINAALPQWGTEDLRKAQRNAGIKQWYNANEGKGDQAALDKWLATSGYTSKEINEALPQWGIEGLDKAIADATKKQTGGGGIANINTGGAGSPFTVGQGSGPDRTGPQEPLNSMGLPISPRAGEAGSAEARATAQANIMRDLEARKAARAEVGDPNYNRFAVTGFGTHGPNGATYYDTTDPTYTGLGVSNGGGGSNNSPASGDAGGTKNTTGSGNAGNVVFTTGQGSSPDSTEPRVRLNSMGLPISGFAKGGLAPKGFVIPADVVSHFGNGSSEAGLKLLVANLGAEPIKGEGDGMSDSIPTTIGGKQEARVANEEAFISPEMVKRIGGGDAEKGAKKLYAMMDRVREERTGTTEQGKQIDPNKFMPGGSVKKYQVGGTTTKTTPAGATGSESSLSNWAGDYVTNMLGQGAALANKPYDAYTGPLTAGASGLQNQAFTQAAGLQTPASIGQAATTAGGIASMAPGAGKYTPVGIDFGVDQAQQYMNPYVQSALNPAMEEARRQADISRVADAGRLTQAGAYGGGRQAIMESEGRRNLMDKQNQMLTTGYSNAFDKAQQQFNADQARRIQEQQFGTTSGLQGLQTGLQGAQTQGQLGSLQSQTDLAGINMLAGLGGIERGIESEGIAADKAQFEEARLNPYKMVQFQQSLLSGMPLSAQSYNMPGTNNLTQFAEGATIIDKLLSILSGKTAATTK
jgi:hypothetical protein